MYPVDCRHHHRRRHAGPAAGLFVARRPRHPAADDRPLGPDGLYRHAAGGSQPQHRQVVPAPAGGSLARPLGQAHRLLLHPDAVLLAGLRLHQRRQQPAGSGAGRCRPPPQPGAGGLGLYPVVWRHGLCRHQAGGLPQPADVHRQAGDHGGGAGAAAAAHRRAAPALPATGSGAAAGRSAGHLHLVRFSRLHPERDALPGGLPQAAAPGLRVGLCPAAHPLRAVAGRHPGSAGSTGPAAERWRARHPAGQRRQAGELARFQPGHAPVCRSGAGHLLPRGDPGAV